MDGIVTYTPQNRCFPADFEIRSSHFCRTLNADEQIRAEGDPDSKMILRCDFAVFDGEYVLYEDKSYREYETIDPHAFDDTLKEDIRALINHNTDLVLGRTTANTLTLGVDKRRLYGEIVINRNDQDAVNLWHRVKRRDVTGNSFGFIPIDVATECYTDADGREIWHRTLRKVRLIEVSPCTFPAYRDTVADAEERKKAREESNREWGLMFISRLQKKEESKC